MKRNQWNTLRISVPAQLVYRTPKTGKEKLVNTLTKTQNLATRGGLKSVVLVADDTITKPVYQDMEIKDSKPSNPSKSDMVAPKKMSSMQRMLEPKYIMSKPSMREDTGPKPMLEQQVPQREQIKQSAVKMDTDALFNTLLGKSEILQQLQSEGNQSEIDTIKSKLSDTSLKQMLKDTRLMTIWINYQYDKFYNQNPNSKQIPLYNVKVAIAKISTPEMYHRFNNQGGYNNNYFDPIVVDNKTFIRQDGKYIDQQSIIDAKEKLRIERLPITEVPLSSDRKTYQYQKLLRQMGFEDAERYRQQMSVPADIRKNPIIRTGIEEGNPLSALWELYREYLKENPGRPGGKHFDVGTDMEEMHRAKLVKQIYADNDKANESQDPVMLRKFKKFNEQILAIAAQKELEKKLRAKEQRQADKDNRVFEEAYQKSKASMKKVK